MEKRRIASLEISVTGLGCNNFGSRIDEAATHRVVGAALDAGINFFDTADIYGQGHSEEFLGRALKGKRDRALIATKFGMKMEGIGQGANPEYVRSAVESSLKRLQIDCIDLYQLHRPDPNTPIADTLGALNDLVGEGKVRELGCSNFSVSQLQEARKAVATGARFVSVQNEYSMLHREPERGVLAECQRQDLAFLPYFPLANGLLSGKYRAGKEPPKGSRGAASWGTKVFTPENLAKVEALTGLAESRGHTLLEMAFSWLAAQPQIASVIAGATSPEQVSANAKAVSWKLTPAELREIESLLEQAVQ